MVTVSNTKLNRALKRALSSMHKKTLTKVKTKNAVASFNSNFKKRVSPLTSFDDQELQDVMLDWCSSGLGFHTLGISLAENIYRHLVTIFLSIDHEYKPNMLAVNVQVSGTHARVVLNKHRKSYYLNIEGNPISFNTGQNIVGTVNMPVLIRTFYNQCFQAIQAKAPAFVVPPELQKKVEGLDIYIYKLAFACYTEKLVDKHDQTKLKELFDLIEHMYCFTVNGFNPGTFKEAVGVRVVREGPYSMHLTKVLKDRHRVWTLGIYDKNILQEKMGRSISEVACGRARLDLTLSSHYLKCYNINHLATIHAKYGHDYIGWVRKIIESILHELKLSYMFKVALPLNNKYIKRWSKSVRISKELDTELTSLGIDTSLSYEAHALILFARATYNLDKEDIKKAIVGCTKAVKDIGMKLGNNLHNPSYFAIAGMGQKLLPVFKEQKYKIVSGSIVAVAGKNI